MRIDWIVFGFAAGCMGLLSMLRRQMTEKIYLQNQKQFGYFTSLKLIRREYKLLFGEDSLYDTTTWLRVAAPTLIVIWFVTKVLTD